MNKGSVIVVDHPLVQHKMSIIRDKNTPSGLFRQTVNELAFLEGYEATKYLSLKEVGIETPIQKTRCQTLKNDDILIVPILRAGLGLVDGLLKLCPSAKVGHLGMQRNESTHEPEVYYNKMPNKLNEKEVFLVDPMLATGGSLCMALKYLREHGVTKEIIIMVLVASPEGIEAVQKADGNTKIITCSIDEGLNEDAYIVPGLGDAGDRIFGTT